MHNHWMQKSNEKRRSLPPSRCCIKYKVYAFYSRVPSVASTSLATTPRRTVGARGPGAMVPPDFGSQLIHGHLHTGQLCRHFFFCQVTRVGAVTWDPNYTPGVDFLDHDFL